MLVGYEFIDGYIKSTNGYNNAEWLDLSDPTEEELQKVKELCNVPDWFIEDALDESERPHIDLDGNFCLIVVRLSTKTEPDVPKLFSTIPVGIIFTPEKLITVCRHQGFIRQLLSRNFERKRPWSKIRLAFAVFHSAADGFINNLEYMENFANDVELRLRRSARNEEILNLLNVQKSLIDTTVALKTNYSLMEKFTRPDNYHLSVSKEELDILDDAMTENQQAIFMAEILNQTMSSMSDAFSSVISNNLNIVMKFLAGITIVLMVPSIIAGFVGMNVEIPWSSHPFAFWWLLGISTLLMLGVSIYFAKKRWL